MDIQYPINSKAGKRVSVLNRRGGHHEYFDIRGSLKDAVSGSVGSASLRRSGVRRGGICSCSRREYTDAQRPFAGGEKDEVAINNAASQECGQ